MNDIATKSVKSNWRDILPVHPVCDIIPPNTRDKAIEIGRSIRKKGMLVAVVILATPVDPVTNDNKKYTSELLDGITRLDGPALAGGKISIELDTNGIPVITSPEFVIPTPNVIFDEDGTFDAMDFVITTNVHRRHLKKDQWQKILDAVIAARPALSDHAIATMVGVSHHTVKARRRAIGKLPIADRLEADGKKARGRKPNNADQITAAEPVADILAEPEVAPGGEPAKVAMAALCWLGLAASPDLGDPDLAEHLTTIAKVPTDPFPASAVDRVIALLTEVARRLRDDAGATVPDEDPVKLQPEDALYVYSLLSQKQQKAFQRKIDPKPFFAVSQPFVEVVPALREIDAILTNCTVVNFESAKGRVRELLSQLDPQPALPGRSPHWLHRMSAPASRQ